jgi:hypothetical protein
MKLRERIAALEKRTAGREPLSFWVHYGDAIPRGLDGRELTFDEFKAANPDTEDFRVVWNQGVNDATGKAN